MNFELKRECVCRFEIYKFSQMDTRNRMDLCAYKNYMEIRNKPQEAFYWHCSDVFLEESGYNDMELNWESISQILKVLQR